MDALQCNENTNIDFTFGSAAAGTLTLNAPDSLNYLTFNSPNVDSHLQFLDVDGNNRSYSLKGISLVPIASARVQFDLSTYATHGKIMYYFRNFIYIRSSKWWFDIGYNTGRIFSCK